MESHLQKKTIQDGYEIIHESHPDRTNIERIIAKQYKTIYNATIDSFFQTIIRIYKNSDTISLAGFRDADTFRLYLENYLDNPVEIVLSMILGSKIYRPKLVEIGNLLSLRKGGGIGMIIAITTWCQHNNYEWVVCTVTQNLYSIFQKLNIDIVELGVADKKKLSQIEQLKWGNYYESNPTIIALNVKKAKDRLQSQFSSYYHHMEKFTLSLT